MREVVTIQRGTGADPGFDQGGGPQIVTGLKLPFWGLSFVEFWCWGLIFGGQGGGRAPPPPGSAPAGGLNDIQCSYAHRPKWAATLTDGKQIFKKIQ